MKSYVMAVDDGTTGIRSILFDHDAEVVAQSYEELHQYFPRSGWCEQDPMEIWEKAKKVMKKTVKNAKIDGKQIKAIGIATQRSTNLLWDKQTGKPVYNAITWQDTRAAGLCTSLEKTPKMKTVRGIGKATKAMSQVLKGIQRTKTGARLITTSTLSLPAASSLAHTRWIMDEIQEASDLRKKQRLLCGTIDTWLIWNMTNGRVHATDFSNASTSGMFDMYTESWSDFLLDIARVPSDILPMVNETNGDFGLLDKSILGVQIPLCCAVADQQAALFAEGCFQPGDVKCTNGTGSFIDMNVGSNPPASLHRLLPLVAWKIKGKTTYMLEGMINTTGSAVQWLKDNLCIIDNAEQSDKMASSVNHTEGVYFVPAFTGLSSPYWDPHACGIVVGLNRRVQREHIVRAALEGIGYRCYDVIKAMHKSSGLSVRSLKADGGASKNNFLLQFLADMLQVEVQRAGVLDGTALGAAYFAGLGSGFWKNEEEILRTRKIDKVFKPGFSVEKRDCLYEGWKNAIERALKWKTPLPDDLVES